ncbi:MAG: hypothetical protein KC503_02210 [Myxococcales bacterium]|nr:hypothetical protein [Myxococcales bacterium]
MLIAVRAPTFGVVVALLSLSWLAACGAPSAPETTTGQPNGATPGATQPDVAAAPTSSTRHGADGATAGCGLQRAFEPAQRIGDIAPQTTTFGPDVVGLDGRGNAMMLGTRWTSGGQNIVAQQFSPNGGWQLAHPIGSGARFPQIAMNAAGAAVAVWDQSGLAASYYTSTSGWQPAQEILQAERVGWIGAVQVAIDRHGDAIVTWRDASRLATELWVRRYSARAGWLPPLRLDRAEHENTLGEPSLAMDDAGNAVLLWTRTPQVDRPPALLARRFDVERGWRSTQLVSSGTEALAAKVALGARGEAIAVWHQADGHAIWAARAALDGPWQTPERIGGLAAGQTGFAHGATVAADARGDAIVAWLLMETSRLGNGVTVVARRYRAGRGWDSARALERPGTARSQALQLRMDACGNALLTWQRFHDDHRTTSVWYGRHSASGQWRTAALVVPAVGVQPGAPHLALTPAGDAIAVWAEGRSGSDGSWTRSMWARRLVPAAR